MPTVKSKKQTPQGKQEKVHWKPGTVLYPLPAVLVSCGTQEVDHNIITISWVGTVCSDPPMLSISVRPNRYSYPIIKKTGEFVVNLPSRTMLKKVDYCGVRSGKDINKWEKCSFKKYPSKVIKTPQIAECPVCIECVVKQVLPLGSHDCFISEVVNVSVAPELINSKGRLTLEKADLFSYNHGYYQLLGKVSGRFGHSVRKNKRR